MLRYRLDQRGRGLVKAKLCNVVRNAQINKRWLVLLGLEMISMHHTHPEKLLSTPINLRRDGIEFNHHAFAFGVILLGFDIFERHILHLRNSSGHTTIRFTEGNIGCLGADGIWGVEARMMEIKGRAAKKLWKDVVRDRGEEGMEKLRK